MAYVTLKYDYYKNPISANSLQSTITSPDGNNTYRVKLTFVCIPEDNSFHRYTNTYQTTQTNLTNNDYGYGMPTSFVYCFMEVFDSSGNSISYKDPNGQIKIYLGKDSYSFSLSNPYYYTNNSAYGYTVSGLTTKFNLETHGHNPLDGSRSTDSSSAEFITTDQTKIKGKTSSVSVSYTQLKLASVPTVDKKYIYISSVNSSNSTSGNLVISTNRNNSNLTHDIKVTIGASELYRGNGSPSSNDVDNYLVASNVGTSYSWPISSIRNLMNKSLNSTWNSKVLVYIRCDTKYNGSIVGTTYTHFVINIDVNSKESPMLTELTLNNGTVFNNQIYFINGIPSSTNLTFSGYVRSGNSGKTVSNMRVRIYEERKYTKIVNKSMNVSSGSSWFNMYVNYNCFITDEDSVSTGRSGDKVKYNRINCMLSDSSGSTLWSDELCLSGVDYTNPQVTGFNIYRVDDNDISDPEGQYLHISFGGKACSFQSYIEECFDPYNFGPQYNYNYVQLQLKYKKQTDSSWTTTTLGSQRYDTSIQYDNIFKGNTFDPELAWDFQLVFNDRYNTITKTLTLRPPIILIDYNQSGKSLSFGKVSEATVDETIIESIFPIIFSDNVNKVSSLNSGTTALITERGTNSSQYYNIFVQRTSSGSRAYGITCMDTDSNSSAVMRLNCFQSRLDIMYKKMQFYQWASDYYWEVNPESTYCTINTNSSYFYFNKDIYVNGNILATRSWTNTQLDNYAPKSTAATLSGNEKSDLVSHSSGNTQNKLFFGKNGNTLIQLHWGRADIGSIPSTYDGQYAIEKSISFSTGFGKTPVVVVTPILSRSLSTQKHWKCDCTISSIGTSSFTVQLTAEGWQGTGKIFWIAIGAY